MTQTALIYKAYIKREMQMISNILSEVIFIQCTTGLHSTTLHQILLYILPEVATYFSKSTCLTFIKLEQTMICVNFVCYTVRFVYSGIALKRTSL